MTSINNQLVQLKANIKFFEDELNKSNTNFNSNNTKHLLFTDKEIVDKRKERVQQIFHTLKNIRSTSSKSASALDANTLSFVENAHSSWNTISDKIHENLPITEETQELLEKAKAVSAKIQGLQQIIQDQAKKKDEVEEKEDLVQAPKILQNDTIQQLLKNSLPYYVKKTSDKYPVLFSCAENFVNNILAGTYGETLKQELLSKNGDIYEQNVFVKLLLIDICRNNIPLQSLEFINDILKNKEDYITQISELKNLITEAEIKKLENVYKELSPKIVHAAYTDATGNTQFPEHALLNKVVAQLIRETITRSNKSEGTNTNTEKEIKVQNVPYTSLSRDIFSNFLIPYISLKYSPKTDILHECILIASIKQIIGIEELYTLVQDKQSKEELDFLFSLLKHSNSNDFSCASLIKTKNHIWQLEKFIKILVKTGFIEKAIELILSLPEKIFYPHDRTAQPYEVHNQLLPLAIEVQSYIDEDLAIALTKKYPSHKEIMLGTIATTIGYKKPEKALEIVQSLATIIRVECEKEIIWSVAEIHFDKALKLIEQLSPKMKNPCLSHICEKLIEKNDFEKAWKVVKAISNKKDRFLNENNIIAAYANVDLKKALELFKDIELENRDSCLIPICKAFAKNQEIENAFEYAKKITKKEIRFAVEKKILSILTRKDTKKAIELLNRIDNENQNDCICGIIDTCIDKNEFDTALHLIKTLRDLKQQITYEKRFVEALAKENLQKALEFLNTVVPENKSDCTYTICKTLIENKKYDEAWELLQTISHSEIRSKFERYFVMELGYVNPEVGFKYIEKIKPEERDIYIQTYCIYFSNIDRAFELITTITKDEMRLKAERDMFSEVFKKDLEKGKELIEYASLENKDELLLSLCYILIEKNRIDEALEFGKKIKSPTLLDAYSLQMSIAFAQRNNLEKALEFTAKISDKEELFTCKKEIITTIAQIDINKALDLMERLSEIKDELVISIYHSLVRMDRVDEALEFCKKIKSPELIALYSMRLSVAFAAKREFTKAFEVANHILNVNEFHKENWLNEIVKICLKNKKLENLQEFLKTISNQDVQTKLEKQLVQIIAQKDLTTACKLVEQAEPAIKDDCIIVICRELQKVRRTEEAFELAITISDSEKRDQCLAELKQKALEKTEVIKSSPIFSHSNSDSESDSSFESSDDE